MVCLFSSLSSLPLLVKYCIWVLNQHFVHVTRAIFYIPVSLLASMPEIAKDLTFIEMWLLLERWWWAHRRGLGFHICEKFLAAWLYLPSLAHEWDWRRWWSSDLCGSQKVGIIRASWGSGWAEKLIDSVSLLGLSVIKCRLLKKGQFWNRVMKRADWCPGVRLKLPDCSLLKIMWLEDL